MDVRGCEVRSCTTELLCSQGESGDHSGILLGSAAHIW